MSQDIRGLWSPSTDPQTRFMTAVANKLTKFLTANQVEAVENDNEDIYSNCVDVESAIKFHTFNGQHLFQFNKIYYPTFEPDYSKLTCWIRARNVGNSIIDLSGFNNTAYLVGDPLLVDGKEDIGCNINGTKSLAVRFNRPNSEFENFEYAYIRDAQNIQIDELTTGFSEVMPFKIYSIAQQANPGSGSNPIARTLWEKIDDSAPLNARMCQVKDNGRIVYIVLDGGTLHAKETASDIITPNLIGDINPNRLVTTYNASTGAIKIYLNGTDLTLTDYTGTVSWQHLKTYHDLYLFYKGYGANAGYVYGDFHEYRMYSEKILSQSEVTNLNTNKWTIWNVSFGQCMITDHWATYAGSGGSGTASFDNTSFDPISFTI